MPNGSGRSSSRARVSVDDMAIQRVAEGLRQPLPETLGKGSTLIRVLDEDLSYIETRYRPSRDLAIFSQVDHPEPRLVVTLGVQGVSRFTANSGPEVIFREGFSTVTTFASSRGAREYQAAMPVAQLRLSLTKGWLDRHFGTDYCPHLFDRGSVRVVSHRPMSSAARVAAGQLLNDGAPMQLRSLFVHGQALAILAAELECLQPDSPAKGRLSARDVAAAHQARDILLDEFREPPSVEQLARRVGINQFKLKQLFHQLFQTTPYALLLETRMQHAYRMLEATRCHVSVAAYAVGYRHATNFSVAFQKYFGVSPKSVRSKS
ncbi:AraC family transcriptional regulator [Methylolobus aquaticus]|nr:AraC family transcriptional regulator [Methylolobus aquaticus]